MGGPELRALIREVLAEELGAAPGSGAGRARVTEERVAIRTDADLAAFVQRLMRMAGDGRMRAEIEAGRHIFRLAEPGAPTPEPNQPTGRAPGAPPAPVRFASGLVTERDVAKLPEGLRALSVAKTVRFTPLARDDLRRRGIKIERTST